MATSFNRIVTGLKQAQPESWPTLLAAFSASYGVGALGFVAFPFALGATIDGMGISTTQAGLMGTAEFASIMLASFAISPFISRVPRRWVALAGVIVAIALNIVCATLHPLDYNTALILRALIGAGSGITMAAGNATVANANDPERLSAQMSTGYVLMMMVSCLIFPWASYHWGYSGVYLALAAMMLFLCPFLMRLPQHPPKEIEKKTHDDGDGKNVNVIAAGAILLAMLIFATRDMSGWTFVERIGMASGYTMDQVGSLLSFQAILGVAGPMFASFLGARKGLTLPIVLGVLAAGAPYYLMLVAVGSKLAFTIAALFLAGTYFFAQAYLIALAAELDRKGRIVAAAGGFVSGGSAIGPALGGYLIDNYGYSGTSWASLSMVIATVALARVALAGRNHAETSGATWLRASSAS
ncbi:MFS transporter [Sphingomonas histidinilytica]|uniref:MFS transporter n=1 Tax=Rhizorhabdus histidinilytica TaxID=439228 RepID=UPI001ADC5FA0|nr:MFS transporter [Rhizorhabdus histidinilytica]MBO9379645.1 MFS transporter [Rhizorhabdus histidinilytica]